MISSIEAPVTVNFIESMQLIPDIDKTLSSEPTLTGFNEVKQRMVKKISRLTTYYSVTNCIVSLSVSRV